jgi:8-oxo-dGTP pyrophosphatase MutT (NUDIX family)
MKAPILEQVAALPYRLNDEGHVEVLLVTSRGSKRWLVPKGNLEVGRAAHETAAREAFEEAGVIGEISDAPIGSFPWTKSGARGAERRIMVTVFSLKVASRERTWPEKGQRRAAWFLTGSMGGAELEPELHRLISAFGEAAGASGP